MQSLSTGKRPKSKTRRKSSSRAVAKRSTPRKKTAPKRRKKASRDFSVLSFLASVFRPLAELLSKGLSWLGGKSKDFVAGHLRFSAAVMVLFIAAGLYVGGFVERTASKVSTDLDEFLVRQGLTVDEVRVSGRQFTSKEALNQALSVKGAVSFFRFDLESARQRVEALHWVDEASINRYWPDTLFVTLTEKQPIAVWQFEKKLYLIDRKGAVISDQHHARFPALPHVVGKGAAAAAPGLVELLSLHKKIAHRVRASIRVGERRWTLRLDNGIDVLLPDEKPELAVSLLVEMQDRYRILSRDIDVIDLRQPDRMYLKSRTDGRRSEITVGMGA